MKWQLETKFIAEGARLINITEEIDATNIAAAIALAADAVNSYTQCFKISHSKIESRLTRAEVVWENIKFVKP